MDEQEKKEDPIDEQPQESVEPDMPLADNTSENEEANEAPIPLENRTFIPEEPNKKAFLVVCGHDEKMKKTILPFLEDLGCTCHYTLDKINTQVPLVQKAIQYKHIKHAFVILTPDNFVYARDSKPAEATMQTDAKVVFELGFWTGKLGRENIATIFYNQKSFQNPTNTFDTFTIPFDKSNAWKAEIQQRLKRWGLAD